MHIIKGYMILVIVSRQSHQCVAAGGDGTVEQKRIKVVLFALNISRISELPYATYATSCLP